jgi:hypothetical protein
MGFTPDQVWAMSLWEFMAAWSGWRRANGSAPETQAPSPEDHAAMLARHLARRQTGS